MSKFKSQGHWDYYKDLSLNESSDNQQAVMGDHMGLFQMCTDALIDTGYIDKSTKQWKGKNGINSKEEFLNNKEVQEIAIREYHKIIWESYLKDYQQHVGKEIGGIKLSQANMIAAAHLVGGERLKDFINSAGTIDKADQLGTKCSDYLKGFSDKKYKVDYSTAQLQQNYEQNYPELIQVAVNNNNQPKQDEKLQAPTKQEVLQNQPAQPTALSPKEEVKVEQQPQQDNQGIYKVQSGDTLSAIAQKNNMSLEQLLNIPGNEQFKANPNAITPTQEVQLVHPGMFNNQMNKPQDIGVDIENKFKRSELESKGIKLGPESTDPQSEHSELIREAIIHTNDENKEQQNKSMDELYEKNMKSNFSLSSTNNSNTGLKFGVSNNITMHHDLGGLHNIISDSPSLSPNTDSSLIGHVEHNN